MLKPANNRNFVVCPSCQGREIKGLDTCPLCHDLAVGYSFGGIFLFWDRKINRLSITLNQIELVVNLVLNAFLLIFGLLGISFLGYWIWSIPPEYFSWQLLAVIIDGTDKSFIIVFFWLTIVADLFLFYRFNRESEKQVKIKKIRTNPELSQLHLNWAEFQQLPKEQKIEVSRSYSYSAFSALERAYLLALRLKSNSVEPIHLAAVILDNRQVKAGLARLEIDRKSLIKKTERALSKMPLREKSKKLEFSSSLKMALISAYANAYSTNKKRVEVIDLFLGACEPEGAVKEIFYDLGIDFSKLKNIIRWIEFAQLLKEHWKKFKSRAKYKPSGSLDKAMTAFITPFLDHFSVSLTNLAKGNYLSPCWGRDSEIDEVLSTIESGSRKHVILVGESGVGKTSIIEGVAQRMAAEDVPQILRDKRLMSLSISELVGGTSPEQAQERLKRVIAEATGARNIVLSIENIRQLIGITTGAEQSLDLASILAHALKNNYFLCLATATPQDYAKYLENSELGAVFHRVNVEEVSINEAIQILEARSAQIEAKNSIYFSYESIAKSVELSQRYIHDRYLPEKAIDILEKVAPLVRRKRGKNSLVNTEDIAVFVSEVTGIPVNKISEAEGEKLLSLEDQLHLRVIGQEEAVKMVAASLRRSREGLRDPNRPIANLLFLGPTGVGKTELAKTVAESYFESESNMIRLDMSEYQEVSSINRLIGSPDGSINGLLTEAVRNNPFSLVLLDEIEKAEGRVLNLFLQVMDDGRLTDNQGRVIDFTNAIIIATSNADTDYIQEQLKLGVSIDKIRHNLINDELKKYFRPEFLNRFDAIIVFRPLSFEEVKKITRLMLNKVSSFLEVKGVGLRVTEAAVEELAQEGFDPILGARPLRRVIQERVDDVLANFLLKNEVSRRDVVVFDAGANISIEKAEKI